MAVLNIKWDGYVRVTPEEAQTVTASEDGDVAAKAAPAERARADRPMMFFITDPADEEENSKTKTVAFDPDKVRVGASLFRCMEVSKDQIAGDTLLEESGKKFPRIVFVSMDWQIEEVVDGKVSSSKVYDGMKKLARSTYEGNFDRNVKQLIKLLGEFDKVANELKQIEDKESRDPNEAEKKRLAQDREELAEKVKELEKERDELLKPELKAA